MAGGITLVLRIVLISVLVSSLGWVMFAATIDTPPSQPGGAFVKSAKGRRLQRSPAPLVKPQPRAYP